MLSRRFPAVCPLSITHPLTFIWFAIVPTATGYQNRAGHAFAEGFGPPIYSIPLQKQYVPIVKNNETVAYKSAYFGEVQAGIPAQTFTVVFDTGSGHFILPTTSCQSEICAKHHRYNRSTSTSAVETDHTGAAMQPGNKDESKVVVSFGAGKVVGEFVQELVCIGNTAASCVQMQVVLATTMSPEPFGQFAFDGVMGLGLDSLRLNPKFSLFGEMIAQNPRMLPQFSVFLSHHDDGGSMISFGGYDKQRASSDVAWAPVAFPDMGYWQVQIKQIRIGGSVLEDCSAGDCRAVLDTGTSLLGVPRESVRAMHRMLARPAISKGVDPREIDCRQVPGPSIEFDLGEISVSMPVEEYSRPSPILMTTTRNESSYFCRSLLLPVDMKPPLGPKIFVFGEPFLRRYLTVYDLAEKRIGFSLAREPGVVV